MFVLNTKAPRISWLIAASTAAAACALLIAYFLLPSGDEKPKRSTGVASATANPGPNPHLRKEPPEDRIAALPTTGSHSSGLENSSAQQKPLTFESAGDLYALASRALNSKDPMELYNGWIATRICTRAASDRATLEHLIAIGGKELSRFEAVRSAKIIINRCHGFFNNDHAAHLGFEARFEEKIRTNPDFYFEGAASTAPTDEQFASILNRGDWYTFTLLMQEMISRSSPTVQVRRGTPDEVLFGIGWMQAACDLGRDCGPNSLSYANFCLAQDNCVGSWEKFLDAGLSEVQQAEVIKYRKKIVQAFLQRDLDFFGIRR